MTHSVYVAQDAQDVHSFSNDVRRPIVAARAEVDYSSGFEGIVSASQPMRRVLRQVERVAPWNTTVLVLGETGTGKELIARAIHHQSERSRRPFVRVNCAAIPQSLIAAELFGHEKGAFTGALQRRLGRFENAEGGTILLDEVGELPLETQIALLRVLQEREFERVGGTQPIAVDVRIIAATNRDLESAINEGTFRPDLFYRLNVFPIHVPALRERKGEIPMLLDHFIQQYAGRMGRNIRSVSSESLELLQAYDWPGNIRELQNVVERSLILSSGDVFCVDESWFAQKEAPGARRGCLEPADGECFDERSIIEAALAESRGRVAGATGAAAKLRVPRSTLESRIKTLNIRKNRFKFRGARLEA